MARREKTPDGAWFVAARVAERSPHGPGAISSCRICGAEVWVEADDAGLAQSCAAIACPDCTSTTTHGILYIPPAPMIARANGADHEPAEAGAPQDGAARPPLCSGCGQPVAEQEPAWIEERDGTIHPSSSRNFDAADRADAWRIWHVACFTPEPDDDRR